MSKSKPTEIREFWIEPWSWSRCERNNLWGDKSQGVCTVHYVTPENTEEKPIHVIEYRAVEQLKAEIESIITKGRNPEEMTPQEREVLSKVSL